MTNTNTNTNLIYSEDVTKRLREELGDFSVVRFVRSYTRWVGTGYRNFVYVVDEKWQVTVSACYTSGVYFNSYNIEDYKQIVASKKAYGRRVSRLAKQAGVPWDIAVFTGNLADDGEVVAVLKAVKAAKGTADKATRWELSCGIGRRVAAIEKLLGGDTWKKLSCRGQRQTKTLADYLLGEE